MVKYFSPFAVPFLQYVQRNRLPGILWVCSQPNLAFGSSSHTSRIVAGWVFFGISFFSSPWLSKCTKVSLRQMANISPFLTSVKTSKSTFMTFHTEFFFYIPLKGHRILMSLAFMILICHVLLPSYNKLTKGKGEKQGI